MSDNDELMNDDTLDADEEDALLKSDDEDENGGITLDSDSNNDDDDNSDDDLDDKESQLIKNYIETLALIDQSKYDYNSYVKLVEIAHQLVDLDKIRQSCELFSTVYPLSPEIWLNWLKIEVNLVASPSDAEQVEKLFRRALNDYYSSDVAFQFALFAYKSPNADAIWNELLAVYALNCMKGRQFFIEWRKYYMKKNADATDPHSKLIEVYKTELETPLYDMEESYIEFKVYCEKNKTEVEIDWEKIDTRYKRAKDHLQKILPFEKQLAELETKSHQDRAQLYKKYVEDGDRYLDENILQSIYERMVTDCCLNADCWYDYIKFIERRDKYGHPKELKSYSVFQQTTMDLVERALRNCTWSDKLYIKKLHLAEKMKLTKKEVQEIIELALEAGFPTPEPAVAIWLEYLSYLRRHTNYIDENEVDTLRANFNLCWNSLGKIWDVLADCNCEILQFWGRLEYGPLQNISKGKELWSTVMESSDNASKSGLWIEFAHLELKRGVEAARKVYRKALSSSTIDNPYIIASAWLRFERCNGSLDEVSSCQQQINSFLKTFEINQKSATTSKDKMKSKATKRKTGDEDKIEAKLESDPNPFKKPFPKADTSKAIDNDEPKVKKSKQEKNVNFDPSSNDHEHLEIDTSKDNIRIFLSNLDYNITENEIREAFPELLIDNINLIKSSNGRGRGFGYVELRTEGEVSKALSFDRRILKGRPVFISGVSRDKDKRGKFKYSESIEPCKLFVKGIPFDSTKDDLEELFKPYGELKDVRLVCHKSGKSKGIAYVEYNDESSAAKAILKLDQHEIGGLKLNVAISAPPPKVSTRDNLNMSKLLGMGSKKSTVKGEQKPRMSLIPTSVRQNALAQNPIEKQPIAQKSNEDFRKLLTKK